MVLIVTFYVVVSRCDLVLSVCRKLLDLLIPPPSPAISKIRSNNLRIKGALMLNL